MIKKELKYFVKKVCEENQIPTSHMEECVDALFSFMLDYYKDPKGIPGIMITGFGTFRPQYNKTLTQIKHTIEVIRAVRNKKILLGPSYFDNLDAKEQGLLEDLRYLLKLRHIAYTYEKNFRSENWEEIDEDELTNEESTKRRKFKRSDGSYARGTLIERPHDTTEGLDIVERSGNTEVIQADRENKFGIDNSQD